MNTPRVTCITINTDASFSNRYKIGTYAFYIICDMFKIQKAGMYKKQPRNPQESELMCIANALHTLLKQPEIPKTKIIVINSDCMEALNKIEKKQDSELVNFIISLLDKVKHTSDCEIISLRHVKAHSGVKDKRSYVNEWCDANAKKWMGVALKKIKNKL